MQKPESRGKCLWIRAWSLAQFSCFEARESAKTGSERRPAQISVVGKPSDVAHPQKQGYGVSQDTESSDIEPVPVYAVQGTIPNGVKT